MSGLPDRLPGRVDDRQPDDLHMAAETAYARDDSYAGRDASRPDSGRRPVHVGQLALDRLARLLSEREMAIVHSVAAYRYLTGHHIEQLHFRDHASSTTAARIRRRVLERLVAGRLLDQLPRPIGGVRAGSGAYVFALGSVGYRLVHGEARRSGTPRHGAHSTSFLTHTLAVAQFGVDLTTLVGRGIEHVTVQTEPHCWRSYQRGLEGVETLKPDLYAVVVTDEYEDRWFIEIDRASESLTAIRRKCQIYLDYYRTGIEQRRSQVFPRVLWVVPDDKRLGQINGTISQLPKVANALFTTAISNEAVERMICGVSA